MDIILAKPRGFCAGVDRAIDIVELALEIYGAPVYMKHEIVHNTHVVERLVAKGAVFVEDLAQIPEGSVTVFSAHGVPPSLRQEAVQRKLNVIDATCPLVTRVHLEAIRFAREGFEILLVGHRGHVEMVGTMGEAPAVTTLVHSVDEARTVRVKNPDKVVALSQTTLSIDDVGQIMAVLKERFPKLTFPAKGDICYATTNRQAAVRDLAKVAPVILVVGSPSSSNANRLREVAASAGASAYMVNAADDVHASWLTDARTVGVTSGASTPEDVFDAVVQKLVALGGTKPQSLETLNEDVWFALPPDLVRTSEQAGKGQEIIAKHAIHQNTRMRVS